jgi:hypothetical protein
MRTKINLKKVLLILSCVAVSITASAKDSNPWKASNSKALLQKRAVEGAMPKHYNHVTLDYTAVKQILATAPMEFSVASRNISAVIELPMPYGGFEKFRIMESPIMQSGLANKYKEIKTYTAQGIDHPTSYAKIDIGYNGFHAMVMSVDGRYFVDPVTKETTAEYISYYRHDLPANEAGFSCGTVASEEFIQESEERVRSYRMSGAAMAPVELRTYRLALACTIEYSKAVTGKSAPTKPEVLAAMITTLNRVNGVYETEVAVRLVLVDNTDTLIYLSGTQPYSNSNGGAMLSQNQNITDARIGNANYDMGHVFSTGGGGIAGLGVICKTGQKANGVTGSPSPKGDAFDIDYVAHEMGHQFGGNHTFNSVTSSCGGGNRNSTTAYEPGSGVTIMAYAGICGADDIANNSVPYFHTASLDEINAYIRLANGGNACPVRTVTANNAPTVEAGPSYTIPMSTPFTLTGSAVDPDGDPLTYSWEQMDLGPGGAPNSPSGNAPLFRFYPPVATPSRTFPKLADILNATQVKGERLPNTTRTMNFRLTARDNVAGAGATGKDQTTVAVTSTAGPFIVTFGNVLDTLYVGGTEVITWDVANSNLAPVNCSAVNILMSTDGGQTFPITLAANTPNDGSEAITVPNNVSNTVRIKVEAAGNIFFDINNKHLKIFAPTVPDFSLAPSAVVNSICSNDTAVYNVSVDPILSFADPVTLSVSGLPAGATASFTSNPVLPGNMVQLKVAATGVNAGNYTFTLAGSAGALNHSSAMTFTVVTSVVAKATLSSPNNAQTNVTPKPTLTWTTVANATAYRVELATDTNFTALVIDSTLNGASSVNLIITDGIPEFTKFFWRVSGVNNCGTGPASAISTFTTGGVPAQPSDLSIVSVTENSVRMKWLDNSFNELSYKVESSINNNQNFAVVGTLSPGTGSGSYMNYVHSGLLPNTTYYYRIYATNANGNSMFSNEMSATTANVGIASNQLVQSTVIYPNPGEGLFHITLSSAELGKVTVQVMDELGRIVQSLEREKSANDMQIDLELDQPKGIYFVKIALPQSNVVKRVIKY